jgi:hypothetical protein
VRGQPVGPAQIAAQHDPRRAAPHPYGAGQIDLALHPQQRRGDGQPLDRDPVEGNVALRPPRAAGRPQVRHPQQDAPARDQPGDMQAAAQQVGRAPGQLGLGQLEEGAVQIAHGNIAQDQFGEQRAVDPPDFQPQPGLALAAEQRVGQQAVADGAVKQPHGQRQHGKQRQRQRGNIFAPAQAGHRGGLGHQNDCPSAT